MESTTLFPKNGFFPPYLGGKHISKFIPLRAKSHHSKIHHLPPFHLSAITCILNLI